MRDGIGYVQYGTMYGTMYGTTNAAPFSYFVVPYMVPYMVPYWLRPVRYHVRYNKVAERGCIWFWSRSGWGGRVREGDGERLDFERGVVSCFCGLCLQREGERPCFRRPLVMAAISRTTIRISWLLVTAVRLMAQYQQLTSELGALSAGAQLLTGTCALSIFFSLSLSLSFLPHRPACTKS